MMEEPLTMENMKTYHACLLLILKEIHRICEKHSIRYFLSDGTLLGAVRHRGFIPWDYDADVSMLRSDYEAFLRVSPRELSGDFLLRTPENDPGGAAVHAALLLKNTGFRSEEMHTSAALRMIGVDLFPLDRIPDSRILQGVQRALFLFFGLAHAGLYGEKILYPSRIHELVLRIPLRVTGLLFGRRLLKRIVDRIVRFGGPGGRDGFYTKMILFGNYFESRNRLSDFVRLKQTAFEGERFWIPENAGTILERQYGDYMTPPPENDFLRGRFRLFRVDFGPFGRKTSEKSIE